MKISIIIPALNEEEFIGQVFQSLQEFNGEIIVADGGSADKTRDLARRAGATVIRSEPGRGRQMNKAAAIAQGDVLVFLHADTRLPVGWNTEIEKIVNRKKTVGGAFQLHIDSPRIQARILEKLVAFRSTRLQLPYGDQVIFLRKSIFKKLHGFKELPIMEDFEFVARLRRKGKIAVSPLLATTSARRWERNGYLRVSIMNQLLIFGFFAGISPERLHNWYRISHKS